MNRTKARSLLLVNWKGVFYERYELDPQVTALEGANGAGKTTVMIAAYLVLLPDLGRLKFTNLGESGATGGDRGIVGRLGEDGGPSYAVLEFETPKHPRLLGGVQLIRGRDSGLDPKTFIVTDLPPDVPLQDLFLQRVGPVEQVPELGELKDAVGRAAARMTVFPSAKDYFQALFEHGITPLRLTAEEEKTKLNEMLRTSMTGGISRSLTNDLRSFLLRPETSLGDTLATMRSNLDACRRTRLHVQASRELQAEISGVYQAGEEMFAAALHATREKAEEARRAVDRARDLHDAARRVLGQAEQAVETTQRAMETADARLRDARSRSDGAKERHELVARAHAITIRLRRLEIEAQTAEDTARAREAEQAAARETLERARHASDKADEAWRLATEGLANLQAGVAELIRRAEQHRQVTLQLARAMDAAGPLVSAYGTDDAHARVRVERSSLDQQASAIDNRIRTAEVRRTEHALAVTALETIVGSPVEQGMLYDRARRELAHLSGLEVLASRLAAIDTELERARACAAKQARVRELATTLGLAVGSALGQALVDAAHDEAERGRDEAEREREARERAEQLASRDLVAAKSRIQALEHRAAAWREVVDLIARLGEPIAEADALDRLEASLREDRDAVVPAIAVAAEQRDRALRAASDLESAGGAFSADLLRIRDEVGGELLASRFDDLDPDDAGPYQALLGPLADAILVDDAHEAARVLVDRGRQVETVWLVDSEQGLDTDPADDRAGSDVVVADAVGVRITRVPERPTLGRRARELRVVELRAEGERREAERLELHARRTAIEARIGLAGRLRSRLDTLVAGDPAAELALARDEAGRASRAVEDHRAAADRARKAAVGWRKRLEALRPLLADAQLLDPPDHEGEVARLEREHGQAVAASAEVERTRDAAGALAERLDELRVPPPTPAEISALREALAGIDARRGRLFLADEALSYVRAHREALAWSDAAPRLEHERALVPELREAEAQAKLRAEQARAAVVQADDAAQTAVGAAQEARGRAFHACGVRNAALDELAAVGVGAPTDEDLRAAAIALEEAGRAHDAVQMERDGVAAAHAGSVKDRDVAADDEQEKGERLVASENEARPHEDRWARLERLAGEHDVLGPALSVRFVTAFTGVGSPNLSTRARQAGTRLAERLRSAQRASEVLAAVEAWVDAAEDRSAEGYLEVWLQVLEWLRRRLPAHIAEVDDPLEALVRLNAELTGLEERLRGQEAQLRGASADVASHIDVQIRKAVGQVQRLNRNLEGVSFGSIGGIRVRSRRIETMARILQALREEGQAQALLFDPGLPFEEALEELFRRYGGGGGSGGQRLLDYREYIDLSVEVKRKASADWEAASATKLSTGEAIGVGAAVMMVVLAEWERDANLLRGKRSHGSLRFLFLDEANRLDRGNLDEIFDLCRTLELQLLIAAPEVARAEGITTYRLERVVDGEGERVLVSGRRTRAKVLPFTPAAPEEA